MPKIKDPQTVIVKYVPSGVRIDVAGIFDDSESELNVFENPTNSSESASNTQLVPPQTICKNKKPITGDFNLNINENAWFQSDIKNAKVDSDSNSLDETKSEVTTEKNFEKTESVSDLEQKDNDCNLYEKLKKRILLLKQKKENCKSKCNCENIAACTVWRENNLNYEDGVKTHRCLFFKKDSLENTKVITEKFNNKSILHGVLIPKPLFSLDETCIDDKIKQKLTELNYISAREIQTYMWPSVQRNFNVFIIAPEQSGKTLSYLPSICTFCIERKTDLERNDGPLILILSSTIENCNDLYNLTKELTTYCSDQISVEVVEDSDCKLDCDILITTPVILEECLRLGKVKLHRLRHIVIENGHITLKQSSKSMCLIFKVLNEIQKFRNKSIQLVVTSVKWSADFEILLKKMQTVPLLCFEDFLGAAVYAKIQFVKKNVKSLYKRFYLIDILKKNYQGYKCTVFCEESDIDSINEHLELGGIECITISKNLTEDEIFENEEMWISLHPGHYKVLLITDSIFEKTVNILNAEWLINFSYPTNSHQFQKRFRSLSANLHSPLNNFYPNTKCFLIIDEDFENQLFIDFFNLLSINSSVNLNLE